MSPAGGGYNVEKSVTITTATAGATIYYTTNGVDPTESDTEYTGAVSITQTTTLKARAFKDGMADSVVAEELYTLTAANPTYSPTQGTYTSNQNVTISSVSQSVTIRYTTDGTTPTEASTVYSSPVLVDETVILKAKAFRSGWTESNQGTASYTMKVATPSLSPTGGSFSSPKNVTVTGTTAGATLHYTTDGSSPTESSPTVTSGNDVTLTQSSTLMVRGFNGIGWTPSDIQLGTFYLGQGAVSAPTAEPAAGTYTEVQTVSLISTTAPAVIRYTTDGSEPTILSPRFTAPLSIDWSLTLKAKAFLPGWTPSSTMSEAYTVNLTNTVAPPSFSPPGGRYATEQTVTLASATSGSTIYYTTNGDEPTTSDASIASGATVTVDASVALKAMAVKATMTDSSVRREDYQLTGAVYAAHQHALALKTDATLVSWGSNSWGQLGNGTTSGSASSPAAIGSFTDVVAIGAYGDQYGATSFAVKSDGTLWGWGHGLYGKLGNGTTTNKTTPTQVSTLTDVVAVAAGSQHTLALESDGDVFAWGGKYEGALGDGTTTGTVTTPQAVSGISNIVAIAAGHRFSLALEDDGTVWAWGRNVEGQLGDGTTTQRNTPVEITNLSGIGAIAAGGYHSLALESDGGFVWAWGDNSDGQVGDGSSTNRSTPLRVAEGVLSISAFADTSLLLHEDSGYLRAVLGAGDHNGYYIDTSTPISSDTFITLLRGDFVQVSASSSIQLALLADTSIVEWGTMEATGADGDVLGDDAGIDDDPDGDGLTTAEEWSLGTDPYDADTNDDGILDGIAVASGMSATDPDMDDDGVLNGAERAQGTDPFNADTDGDTVNDGDDDFPLDPTRDTAPAYDPEDSTPPTITLDEPTNASLISSVP
jgi:alpha-tubulin suppressor-like RCC1 family protein